MTGPITTEHPNEMCSTDMKAIVTSEEGHTAVMVAVDHCSFECVGLYAAKSGNRFIAFEPVRRGVTERLGGFGPDVAEGLVRRHDHTTAYLSDPFQGELRFLGIRSSPAFVRGSEGNGCVEGSSGSLRRTCSGFVPSGPSRSCAIEAAAQRVAEAA